MHPPVNPMLVSLQNSGSPVLAKGPDMARQIGRSLIDYGGGAPYIAGRNFPSVGGSFSPFLQRAGF